MKSQSILFLCFVIGSFQPALAQDASTQTSTLEGVVMASGGTPLAGAKVTLSGDPSTYGAGPMPASVGKTAIADEKGRYIMESVTPGVYILSADAQGYLKQAYGGKPGYFGSYNGRVLPLAASPVTVAANSKISGLDFRLTRLSAISGRITSEKGDPVSQVPVYAVRWTYMDGARRLLEKGRAASGARGEFRIEGLAPGDYFIYAVPPAERIRPGQPTRGKLPTYSPNALGYREAIAVRLTPGLEGFGNVQLREDTLVTVRGRVVGSQGDQPPEGATVLLMQDADTPLTGGLVGGSTAAPPPVQQPYRAIAYADADGEFTLTGVAPGLHRLIALGGKRPVLNTSSEEGRKWSGSPTGEPPSPDEGSLGTLDLLVRNEDVEGVTILLRAGGEITSRIGMEGQSYRDWARERMNRSNTQIPEERRARLLDRVPEVTLIPEAGVAAGGNFPGSADERGGFTQRVTPGRYFLSVSGANQLYYVKSVRLGKADITGKPFDFTGGTVEMEITLGTDAGRVTGFVTDGDGNRLRGASVSLWPVVPDQMQRNGGAIRVNTRHDGSFVVPLVPPGEYYVMAFADLPDPGLGQYPAFVSKFTSAGQRVKVAPNQGATANVEAIPPVEVERALANLP